MAKKEKEISLDELEDELIASEEETAEDEIEEIEEFSLDEISEEEEISEIFEEEALEEFEEEEIPKEEEIIDERIYVVPLAKARKGPRNKWAKKSIRFLRDFMTRHFKPESLIISKDVYERIWAR